MAGVHPQQQGRRRPELQLRIPALGELHSRRVGWGVQKRGRMERTVEDEDKKGKKPNPRVTVVTVHFITQHHIYSPTQTVLFGLGGLKETAARRCVEKQSALGQRML